MPLACNRILLKYNKEITPFKNIKLGLTLTFQFVIFIDNSMICSDIWHKYHNWRNFTYKSCYYLFMLATRKSFVIFTCTNFKLSWNTTDLSQSNCRNFSCIGINREINATAAGLACENIRFSSLFVAVDVSPGGTSATKRQKFHTDDVKSVQNPVRSADW